MKFFNLNVEKIVKTNKNLTRDYVESKVIHLDEFVLYKNISANGKKNPCLNKTISCTKK